MATKPTVRRLIAGFSLEEAAELEALARGNVRSISQEIRVAVIEHLRRARRHKPKQ